jgi:hypothetical protein
MKNNNNRKLEKLISSKRFRKRNWRWHNICVIVCATFQVYWYYC